ncbi:DUF7833 domain-containing protein [Bacteroides ihuae]|uniref:DUF7833 domain-containing protein n=1 Tax=Bacteroides ihuae TaxID=1852362 RepID=UPI0008D94E8E|nr:hypothetical protein [Bacteroides ihuae]
MNQFWKTSQSVEFSSNEAYLYFFLLQECNIRGWENPFECANRKIILSIGVSEPTMIDCRNRLQQKGLLFFEKGKRNAKSPTYYLNDLSKTLSNPFSKTLSNNLSKTLNINKTKDKKTLSPTRAREGHGIGELFPDENVFEKSLEECFDELRANQSWKETFCMNIRIRDKTFMPADFDQYLQSFFRKLANEGETKKAPKDAMSHFARWLDIELKNKKDGKTNQKGSDTASGEPVKVRSISIP